MNLMLLAAGEGTRLRPYTLTKPKPAMPLLGAPLAAHSLSFTDPIGIQNLVVNTFYLPKEIHKLFSELSVKAKNLYFSDEVGQILDTGGGLGKARIYFQNKGDFFLMNADEVILPLQDHAVEKAVDFHRRERALATIIVTNHSGVGTEFGGVWTNSQNQVLGFGKSPLPGSVKGWHFIGAQILSDRIFDYIPEGPSNILYGPVTRAILQGEKVQIYPLDCHWFETGNIKSFLEANKNCLEILASNQPSIPRSNLEKTIRQYSPTEFLLEQRSEGILWRATNVTVPSTCKIVDFAIVGSNCNLGTNTVLNRAIINENAIVLDGTSVIEQVVF